MSEGVPKAPELADEELTDNLIRVFEQFERWNPWHDFKFAEQARLPLNFFVPAIEMAFRSDSWRGTPQPVSDRLTERALQLLRSRALMELGHDEADPRFRALISNVFDPTFEEKIIRRARRVGDLRKFSSGELKQIGEQVSAEWPEVMNAVYAVEAHNRSKDPSLNTVDVVGTRWLIDPIKHALFRLQVSDDAVQLQTTAFDFYYFISAQDAEKIK